MWFFVCLFLNYFFLASYAQITLNSQSFHVCPPSPWPPSPRKEKKIVTGAHPLPQLERDKDSHPASTPLPYSRTEGQWGTRPSLPYPQGTIRAALQLPPKGRASTPARGRTSSPEHMINMALGSSFLPYGLQRIHRPRALTPFHTNMAFEGNKAQAHRHGIRQLHKLPKSTWILGFIEIWRSSLNTNMVSDDVVDDGDPSRRSNPESEPVLILGPPTSFPRARGIWQEAGFEAESISAYNVVHHAV